MSDRESEMRDACDFSAGIKGRRHQAYRTEHTVRVMKRKGCIEGCVEGGIEGGVEIRHFTLANGAVMLDPNSKARFPDSDAVHRAQRASVNRG